MTVDVWSDVVCPWCAIGKAHLEAALEQFEHGDEVEVVWHSFELDPTAPPVQDVDYVELLARKYGRSRDEAQLGLDRMTRRGAEVGLDLRFERIRRGNSLDAHRLLHLARERGLQHQLTARLFRAYFTDGEAIGDHEALARVAAEVGLDDDEVREVLDGDAYVDRVREDEVMAQSMQVSGVPFFVVDRRYGVAGAQPTEVMLGVLEQAWADGPAASAGSPDGAACGPEGCD